ncbi:MAG: tetratricopeptide repeat protein [Actinomycetota bacterium]
MAEGLGERVRHLRHKKGLTQAQLAAPYSAAFVSQIERGIRQPSSDFLNLMAKKLGVSGDQLASGLAASEPEVVLRLHEGWQHLYSGRYDSSRAAFVAAERTARRCGYPVLRADAIAGHARCVERSGTNTDALRLYGEALDLYRANASAPAAVEAIAGLARCHQMRGETPLALHVLESYLVELHQQDLTDPAALMRTYASLVWPYMELGLHEKANDAADRALRLQARVDDPEGIAGMHLNAARALLNSGRIDDALDSLKRAEEIYRDLNWRTEIARARTNRGIVLVSKGDLLGGRAALEEARETFRAVGFTRSEALNLNELARVERLLGDNDRAQALARQALELLSEMDAMPELALAHRELALALGHVDPPKAERHFRQAISLYEKCGELAHAADTCRLLGELLAGHDQARSYAEFHAGLRLLARTLDRLD